MDRKSEMVAALRMLADDIDNNRVPMPYDIAPNVFWLVRDDGSLGERINPADARLSMDLTPGGWDKRYTDAYASYVKNYGGNVTLELNIDRAAVCRKVQTGVRTIEAQDAREVPVYEWECNGDETAE